MLVTSPEAWDTPRGKLKSPERMDHGEPARCRASSSPRSSACCRRMTLLGEPLWRPPAPKGFSDEEAAWIDGLAPRLDIANIFASRVGGSARPAGAGRRGARAAGSAETRQTIARAESRTQAFALLLMSPEFQRR